MAPTNPEVVIAVETLSGGGAERVALALALHWPRDHARPVLLVANKIGEYVNQVPSDVEIVEIGVPSSPRRTIAFLSQLREALRDRNVVGVISHMTAMNRMILRGRLSGIVKAPITVVEHSNFIKTCEEGQIGGLKLALLRAEIGFLYGFSHAVVGCSRGVARQIAELFNLGTEHVHAIVNPVDRRFVDPPELVPPIIEFMNELPRPIIVSVGRFVPLKGLDELVRAFAKQESGSLVLLGDGPLRQNLQELAAELAIEDRVVMPGFVAAPESVLRGADLYVSASKSEGYPLSLIEAYASGLPVVARDCDFGPAEIVTKNRPGILVKEPSIDALATAIRIAIKQYARFLPGSVVDLSENDPDYVAQRYRELLDRCRS